MELELELELPVPPKDTAPPTATLSRHLLLSESYLLAYLNVRVTLPHTRPPMTDSAEEHRHELRTIR